MDSRRRHHNCLTWLLPFDHGGDILGRHRRLSRAWPRRLVRPRVRDVADSEHIGVQRILELKSWSHTDEAVGWVNERVWRGGVQRAEEAVVGGLASGQYCQLGLELSAILELHFEGTAVCGESCGRNNDARSSD